MIRNDSVWTSLAPLPLRLALRVRAVRQVIRGQNWMILQDPLTARNLRVSADAYVVLELLNGSRTLSQAYAMAELRLGKSVPKKHEMLTVLAQLQSADLLLGLPLQHRRVVGAGAEMARKTRVRQTLRSPLAIRIPLVNPDRFLGWLMPLSRMLFSGPGLLFWAVAVIWALIEAGANWNELTKGVIDRVLSTDNLWLMALAFVISKSVHEVGHGLALKRWGGEANEMGISLLVLFPIPYVEASSSTAFTSKWQRIAVGAAGMYAEVLLAVVAFVIWQHSEPGTLRALAYNVMVVAGVSTLLINANPLLRYDGYFILADLLETPNLALRSNRYLGWLWKRYVIGLRSAERPLASRSEAPLFVAYAIASFVCRAFVIAAIAVFLANSYFFIGVALALWLVVSMFVLPLAKAAWFVTASKSVGGHRLRAVATTLTAVAVISLLLFAVPVPMTTRSDGVVWAPPGAEIAAEADGFVVAVHVADGSFVTRGQPILQLENPELPTSVAAMRARQAALQARYRAEEVEDLVKAQVTSAEIEHISKRLAHEEERVQSLKAATPRAGRLALSQASDLAGKFVQRGTVIGHVYEQGDLIVRVVLRQEDIGIVKPHNRVSIRLPGRVKEEFRGEIERILPSATDELPSLALSTSAGGDTSLAPSVSGDVKALQRFYEVHVRLHDRPKILLFGQRAHVQFVHNSLPLGLQCWRRLRQFFLKDLSV